MSNKFSRQQLQRWITIINPFRGLSSGLAVRGLPMCARHRKLLTYKNAHVGKVGFLVGNGPSVRTEDLDKLAGKGVSFCCNRFYLAYPRMSFRPTYLASGDRQMIMDYGEEMLQSAGCPVWFSGMKQPAIKGDYCWVRSFGGTSFRFQSNLCDHIEPGGATLVVAAQIGYWMGIRHFFLYGVDHKFIFQTDTKASDVYQSAKGEGNHFIQNYRSGKAWCPPIREEIEQAFRVADQFLRKEGGWIKNATRGGELEVLERISLEEVIG